VRQQFLGDVQEQAEDPEHIASSVWMEMALPGDPYARETSGTLASVSAVTADDLRRAHAQIFNRHTLQVAVVGDIDAASLGVALDHVFGGLPEGGEAPALPPAKFSEGPALKIIPRDIPQSVIVFGHGGIRRSDPDFIPAYIMSEILGGGSFGTRLTQEIREKSGLTYGVGADLAALERAGLFIGSLGTKNETAGEALTLVRQELKRMAEEGPTAQELAEAKTYLTGSYALRFDGNATTANQLLHIEQDNLGIEYIATRNAQVEAVTLDQVKAQAKRLLHGDKLIVAVVGRPEGLPH
jgi:zinc protease